MTRASLGEVIAGTLTPLVRVRGSKETPEGIVARMARHGIPGAQVAVLEGGDVSWSAGYGEIETGSGRRVDQRTLFQAASISKSVTAFAVLRLVAEGKLDLTRPVNTWLRSWRLPENEHTARRPVTLRELLSHTGSTTVHGFPGYANGEPLPTVTQILEGEPPANTQPVRVDGPVGEQFRYSGGGTVIVQQLLTDVTGQRFEDLTRELALAPLGMADSTYEQPLPARLHGRAATAHDDDGAVTGKWQVYPEMAAAGLWTTAADLIRLISGIQAAIRGRPGALLPATLAREMVTPQNGVPAGLGTMQMGSERDRRFLHSGGNRGFTSRYVGFVEHDDGIAVLTNGPFRGAQFLNEVIGAIGAAQGWSDFAIPDVDARAQAPAELDRFVGTYELPGFKISVRHDAGRLLLTSPFDVDTEMVAMAERDFILADAMRVRFDSDATTATLEKWGEVYVARRSADSAE